MKYIYIHTYLEIEMVVDEEKDGRDLKRKKGRLKKSRW
jgi:hypothetical protein